LVKSHILNLVTNLANKICSVRHLPEAAYADLQAGLDEVAPAISLQLESVQVDRDWLPR